MPKSRMGQKAQENRQNRQSKSSARVNVTKGTAKKNRAIDVKCLYDGDDVVYINFDDVRHATEKSVLLIVDGEKVWLPFTQIKDFDADDQVVVCSEWIAEEKGLESDW